jgi:predicted nucleic acid-binding protein
MAAVLLDTTVLIDLLRGRAGAVERLRTLRSNGDQPCICAINVEELERGAKQGEAEALVRLLDGLTIAPLGRVEGTRAGRWRREHATRGVTLSQADCLIASAAAGVGARLATGNPKDFPMAGLMVEHWPVGD